MNNPLRDSPFFQVANVNPDDPISVQIEQIEQLNTMLLQEIDHNFARFHDVVNNKILPQVKRYALVSQSTQEVSTFWKTFFHAAAFGPTTVDGQDPEQEDTTEVPHSTYYSEHEETLDQTAMMNMTPDEHSFLYGNPVASTPLARHHLRHLEGGEEGANGWAEGMSSMESPYASLDRKMKAVLENDEGMSSTHSAPQGFGAGSGSFLADATPRPQGYSNAQHVHEPYQTPEGMDEEPSVLISRTDMGSRPSGAVHRQPDISLASTDLPDLPNIPKLKARVPFKSPRGAQNPFSPGPGARTATKSGSAVGTGVASGSGTVWNGIADLRNTPLNPKIKPLSFAAKRTPTQNRAPQQADDDNSFDMSSDEEDEAGLGMGTPPMTMNFSLPTRTIISKTPAKEAAKAVIRNLMMDDGMMDSPAMPSPPAFSKYAKHRSGVDKARSEGVDGGGSTSRKLFTHEMEQAGEEGNETVRLDSTSRVQAGLQTLGLDDSLPMGGEESRSTRDPDVSTVGMPKHRRSTVPQLDFLDESFDDSLDEMPLPALPQGYVTANYHPGSSSANVQDGQNPGDDSLAHPGDEAGDFTITDDRPQREGYDDGMTGATIRSEAGEIFGGQGRAFANKGQFALFGPDEMQTFHGGRLLDAAASPQDSPSYALGAKRANKRV